MTRAAQSTLLQGLFLAGLAVFASWLSNALAAPSRKLAWTGARAAFPPPPPRKPIVPPEDPPPDTPSPRLAPAVEPTDRAEPRDKPPLPEQRRPEVQAISTPIREITSQEAWDAFNAGYPFLDARRSAEFAEGHIAGAWCTPVWESDVEDRLFAFKVARRPGPEDPIVIYCSGGECQDSHLLATKLLNEGYFHLLIYRDGFPDWLAQRHPIEKGHP